MRNSRHISTFAAMLGLLFAGLGVARSFHSHSHDSPQAVQGACAHDHAHSHDSPAAPAVPAPGSSDEHCAVCHLIAAGAKAVVSQISLAIGTFEILTICRLVPAIVLPNPRRLDPPSQRGPPASCA